MNAIAKAETPNAAAPASDLINLDAQTLEALVMSGDMARLTPVQKVLYYKARCQAAGLDPRTAPFQYMTLQGKTTLYATKVATDQLAANHKIKTEVLSQVTESDLRIVMVRAVTGDGRATDEMGAVPILNLKGNDLANSYMKAITKAKRRAVLSLCGLGMMDETEIETVAGARRLTEAPMPTAVSPAEPPAPEPLNDAHEDEPSVSEKVFSRVIAEKDPGTGKVTYTAFPVNGYGLQTTDRALAVKIKNAIEAKNAVRVSVMGIRELVAVENLDTALA